MLELDPRAIGPLGHEPHLDLGQQVAVVGPFAGDLPGQDEPRRWLLKSPAHVSTLPQLFAEYPDALVIQCHRPAETLMASMCSLAQHTTEGWSTTFVGATIGRDSMETWSRGLELFNAERFKHNSAQFYDMDYFDFTADPVRELEAIYRHFGIDFTDAARAAAEETHAESKKGPRAPKHTYSLADYGLTDDQVKERFKGL